MTNTDDPYAIIERRLKRWALAQAGILALVVIGSRARPLQPDVWSDLDLIALVRDHKPYTSNLDWLHELGEVWLSFVSHTGAGDPEVYALLAGARKVDIVFEQLGAENIDRADSSLSLLLASSHYQGVLQRGWRALLPGDQQHPFVSAAAHYVQLPSEATFQNAVKQMLLSATQVAKFIQRDEPWRARQIYGCDISGQLYQLISWHALAHANTVVPLPDGKYVGRWATYSVEQTLRQAFPDVNDASLLRAVMNTLALFRKLAIELSERMAFTYPHQADEAVTRWLRSVDTPE